MVKKDDETVISVLSGLDNNSVNIEDGYLLFDCVNGICKQTEGYIFKGENEWIAFKDSEIGERVGTNENYVLSGEDCVRGNNNGLINIKNKGVCYAGNIISLSEGGGKQLIVSADSKTPFNPNKENFCNTPVKYGEKYFIVDKFVSGNA